jgi:outer membrane protein assembly factor BamB/elongation factor P hydroxylase
MPTSGSMTGWRLATTLLLLATAAPPAAGQQENPIYVDISPGAWTVFQLAREQAAENVGEAVRLYQELLDEHGAKLIPVHEVEDDEFIAVRRRVLADLRADESLLARYRLMQSSEARRLLETGAVGRLAETRPLTEAGLDAILRRAQSALESARFHAAVAWLEEAIDHPDLTERRAAHCWYMLGLASHYLEPETGAAATARATEAAEMLTSLGAEGRRCLAELDRLRADGPGPERAPGRTPLDTTDATDLEDIVGQTIWSVALDQSLLNRRFGDPAGDRPPPTSGFERRRRRGELATVAATVAGSVVYVNEGHTIRALDRFTGRDIWERAFTDRPNQAILDRDTEEAGDMNLIAVEGDSLVTLTGHARAASRSSDGRVLCLDARTGRPRWATSLTRIGGDEEYEGLFPHGAPIVSEGVVYVLARKVTGQMLTGCYAVALDLDTGGLRWIRHIASSGSKIRNARPFSTLVRDRGHLFVASPVGAVACLDMRSGRIRWLHRYSVPVNIRGRQRQPWELGGPVVAGDRVIALTPDQRRVVVYDRETGSELESYDARSSSGWSSPSYLLADGDLVFAVGSEIRAFHVDALGFPVWRLPAPAQSRADPRQPLPVGLERDATPERMRLVGRVQIVDGSIIVPTLEGLLFVEPGVGRVAHRLDIDAAGNPVAVGAQLILAGADTLDVYMSLGRAEAMLRERIAAASDDAEPAMSLLQLGMRVSDLPMALEGATLALEAIERGSAGPTDLRRELFAMLLEIHRRRLTTTDGEGDSLYTLIGRVAATTEQRVEYLLAYGDGLSERAPAQAVETWQSILSSPAFAATVRRESGLLRPARHWVAERLRRLIADHGPAVCAPQADFARQTLLHLVETRPDDHEAMLALAREFPFADASVDAALRAADVLRARGEVRRPLAALSAAYHAWPDDARRRRLLGAFVELCVEAEMPEAARAMLAALVRLANDPMLDSTSGPRRAGVWLAALEAQGRVPRRPQRLARVGLVDRPADVLDGRLLRRVDHAIVGVAPDRALIYDGIELRLVTSASMTPSWSVALDDEDAQLLLHDDDELLVWLGSQTEDPRVVALDPATGARRWTSPPLGELVEEPWTQARGVLSQMPNGLPFDPRTTVPAVDADTIYLARRSGAIAAMERSGGGVLWTVDRTLEQVHDVLAHPFGLVLVGRDRRLDARGGSGELEPRLLVLDPRSGETMHRLHPHAGVLWLAADPFGSLVCASAKGIELVDLLQGRRRWTNVAFDAMETHRGWLLDDRVVTETRSNELVALGLEDGIVSAPFDTAVRGTWEPDALHDLHRWGDAVVARYRDRIIRYSADGGVLGADVISDSRDYRLLLPAEGLMLVVSQFDTSQEQIPGEVGRRTQRTYRIYALSESGRLEGDVIEPPPTTNRVVDGVAIDGWVLLSTSTEVLALPLPR